LMLQLEEDRLADDTIVFFFGDNGQGIPGGKIWLWEEGPHVPLIVHLPKKWAHLASSAPGTSTDRLISFLDFAPTMLSLAGVPIPPWMPGVVFLGKSPGKPRRYVHATRDWHDGADFDTSRMVRDAQFHYIRDFMPHIGWDAIQYSWYRAPYMMEEWRQQAVGGKLKVGTRQACFFERGKPTEELYDLAADPFQMHNLADEPRHQKTLRRMRGECERWMQDHHDLGLLSQHELYARSEKDSPYELAQDAKRNPIKQLIAAANLANRRDVSTIPKLLALLKNPDGALRRWGAIGLLALGTKALSTKTALQEAALHDAAPDVCLTAAEALFALKERQVALPVLIELLTHESNIIRNETLLALCRIGEAAREALPHLPKALTGERKYKIGSDDNLPSTVKLAQACLSPPASEESTLTPGMSPTATPRQTREKLEVIVLVGIGVVGELTLNRLARGTIVAAS
jgi:N-sulfoglucosamine sulfohydrolase